jgi:O-antigen/teichoic acid export membrane protein
MSITSLLKLAVAAVLVLGGEGVFGLTVGFTINQVLSAILLAFVTVPYLKSTRHLKSKTSFKNALKNTLFASMVYWIPFLITTIGSQLGTVVVFGTNGSHQAGFFFIALTIVTGITGVVYSLFTIAFPALSAMHDGRKKFTWHTIRLSLIIALPFSTSLIFYSSDILHLLGKDYTEGSLSLQIMLLSIFPTTIQFGINSLVYSYGNYRQVLVIGIASSVSRALLYFILTPFYGGTGAAVGYTIGALLGLVASLLIAKRINMWLYWRKLGMIFAIPLIISIGLYYAKVNYILGICLELIITYIIMLKLDLLSRYDVYDIVKIFPHRISNRIIQVLSIIDRKSSGN